MRSVFRGTKKGPHAEERPQGLWGRVSKHAQRLSSIADATCRRCAPALMAGADYPPRRTPLTAPAAASPLNPAPETRPETRRVGKECVRTWRYRVSPYP